MDPEVGLGELHTTLYLAQGMQSLLLFNVKSISFLSCFCMYVKVYSNGYGSAR